MGRLVARATDPGSEPGGGVEEVILALSATVDGQTTAHYISERLAGSVGAGSEGAGSGVKVSRLAHGVPVGGELDYLDDRSEEHTSELQSLMRNSYAVFCLKKK